jgi:hypothetical protein
MYSRLDLVQSGRLTGLRQLDLRVQGGNILSIGQAIQSHNGKDKIAGKASWDTQTDVCVYVMCITTRTCAGPPLFCFVYFKLLAGPGLPGRHQALLIVVAGPGMPGSCNPAIGMPDRAQQCRPGLRKPGQAARPCFLPLVKGLSVVQGAVLCHVRSTGTKFMQSGVWQVCTQAE